MRAFELPGTARVLLVGYGDLATKIANVLVLDPRVTHLALAGRDEERLWRDANLLRFTALHHGWAGEVSTHLVDLQEPGDTAAALAAAEPTLVINTASVQSWRRLTELPRPLFDELDQAQFGPWLPMHLAPAAALMQVVRRQRPGLPVINAAFPDAVGPSLRAHGLEPLIGAGNVANVVPALRWSAAAHYGCDVGDVTVRLVAQHYYSHRLPRYGDAGEASAAVQITRRGAPLDLRDSWAAIQHDVCTRGRRTGGMAGQALTASSVLTVVRGLLSDRPVLVHAPAPLGLPGGYPVMISRHGMELSLPDECSELEAVAINEHGQYADGIAAIDDQTGVAIVRPDRYAILQRRFPVDTGPIDPDPDRIGQLWSRAARMHASFTELLQVQAQPA